MSIDPLLPGGLFSDDHPGEAVAETGIGERLTMRHRVGRPARAIFLDPDHKNII